MNKFLYTRLIQNMEDFYPPIQSVGMNTAKTSNFANTLNSQVGILSLTTAATLSVASSGSLVLFASATGFTVTLPAPDIGVFYNFAVANAPSSGTHSVITDAATTFLQGGVLVATGVSSTATFVADGSTAVAIRMNGTTTAGSIPSFFTVTCISATKWQISGTLTSSGVGVTPFKTS